MARALLEKARVELGKKENRQAAEKGWLALVTAGRTMLRAAGEDWESSQGVANRLAEIEPGNQPVTSTLRVMAGTLHGTCFYRGSLEKELCGHDAIEANFRLVATAIGDAADFCRRRNRRRIRRYKD